MSGHDHRGKRGGRCLRPESRGLTEILACGWALPYVSGNRPLTLSIVRASKRDLTCVAEMISMTRPPTVSDRAIAVAIGKSIFAYIVTAFALIFMIVLPLQEPGVVEPGRRIGAAIAASIIFLPVIFGLRSWRR